MQVLLKGTLLVTGHAKKVPPAATPPGSAASLLGSPLDSLLTASSAASVVLPVVASRGPSGALPEAAATARTASAAMPDGVAAEPGGGAATGAAQARQS